jgi:hypothetical protein
MPYVTRKSMKAWVSSQDSYRVPSECETYVSLLWMLIFPSGAYTFDLLLYGFCKGAISLSVVQLLSAEVSLWDATGKSRNLIPLTRPFFLIHLCAPTWMYLTFLRAQISTHKIGKEGCADANWIPEILATIQFKIFCLPVSSLETKRLKYARLALSAL